MSRPAQKSAPKVATGCTCLRLRKAARRVSQIYDRHLQRFGLTITQYGLLAHLKALDGIGVSALAGKLVMDPTTLTRNLRPLQRDKLVTLVADPHDRRSRNVHLTAAGRRTLAKARPGWNDAQREIAVALGASKILALTTTIDEMLATLSA